jgi:hypothetical protein
VRTDRIFMRFPREVLAAVARRTHCAPAAARATVSTGGPDLQDFGPGRPKLACDLSVAAVRMDR